MVDLTPRVFYLYLSTQVYNWIDHELFPIPMKISTRWYMHTQIQPVRNCRSILVNLVSPIVGFSDKKELE